MAQYRVQLKRGRTATMTPDEQKKVEDFINGGGLDKLAKSGKPINLKKRFKDKD